MDQRSTGVLVQPGGDPDINARRTEAIQIGSVVKVLTLRSLAFGIVSSLATEPGFASSGEKERYIAEIDLLGEVMSTDPSVARYLPFQRGGLGLPLPGPADLWRDPCGTRVDLCAQRPTPMSASAPCIRTRRCRPIW